MTRPMTRAVTGAVARGAVRRARLRKPRAGVATTRRCDIARGNVDVPDPDDDFEHYDGELLIGPGRDH